MARYLYGVIKLGIKRTGAIIIIIMLYSNTAWNNQVNMKL